MWQIALLGHDAPTAPFSLDDLAGVGCVDLLARCVSAGVFLSHDIRDAVRVHLVLADRLTVVLDSRSLRRLYPDERNIAGRIRGAVVAADDATDTRPAELSPGVTLYRTGLVGTLDRLDTPVV